jgi:carboxyl-terminal processing protease
MLAVTRVRQNSPAARAGLQRGDRVLGFDDQRLHDFETPTQALAALRTAETSGQNVRLRVARGTNTRTLEITSEALAPWPPQLEFADVAGVGKVAMITFFQFKVSGGVASIVHDLVAQANAANAAAMVLDVRDSAGGYVSECLASVSAFVDSVALLDEFKWGTLRFESTQGNFVQTENNGQRYSYAVVNTPQRWRGPLVVLTNQNAKSAPEYLAYLLQRAGRATIIGERTLGALETSNSFFALPDQSSLAISLGRSQHEDKSRFPAFVTPDLRVPDALSALLLGRDAPMQAALKHFGHTP